ncbi:hypothetical protein PG993_006193 [Apiospora rasikravindrae]|uniref:Uncharacterized protein n=1 Tax=Apiospora rasikravindrae TaxID=990691 RepID=A0ABR1T509_9PEZI
MYSLLDPKLQSPENDPRHIHQCLDTNQAPEPYATVNMQLDLTTYKLTGLQETQHRKASRPLSSKSWPPY